MNRLLLFFLTAAAASVYAQDVNIIPRPCSVTVSENKTLQLDAGFDIVYGSEKNVLLPEARYLKEQYRSITGFDPAITTTGMVTQAHLPGKHIVIDIDRAIASDTSGAYRLNITGTQIRITGADNAGVFYGIQSLLQLVYHNKNKLLPQLVIRDRPRFGWRGMHLDVCRHFFPVAFVKKYIDLLALHKMNVFHWHLTDDQGWRIQIKKHPLLTSVGGWRKGSMVGHYSEQRVDTVRYGGYYTQDEIKEVVAYAASRHVTIVPEIEMPGHALAALTAYPQLSCTGGPFEVVKTWGVFDDVFCAGNDDTFVFLQDVLDEVCALFPGRYIHVGGDECPKTRWEKCDKCQARIKNEKLKDAHELQRYFIQRIEQYLNKKGKQIIGWDEILEGGLAPNAAVMSWRGTEGGMAAARQKHYVVMSPGSHCYFDHYQAPAKDEPLAFGGYTPLQKVYTYEPVPAGLTNEESTYIMGAQANLWTEYITTTAQAEYMALPRMSALAEVLWTPAALKNEEDFMQRLKIHLSWLDHYPVHYSNACLLPVVDLLRNNQSLRLGILPSYVAQYTYCTIAPPGKTVRGRSQVTAGYRTLFPLSQSVTVDIVAQLETDSAKHERHVQMNLVLGKSSGKNISFHEAPDEPYRQAADITLVDGLVGDLPRQNNQWLAWQGRDVEMTIDLGKKTKFSKVHLGLLADKSSWIYLPAGVTVLVSDDNNTFQTVHTAGIDDRERDATQVMLTFKKQKARYIRLVIKNAGIIPKGRPGAGQASWIFVSEVVVD